MENIGIKRMTQELIKLNPEVHFDVYDLSKAPVIVIFGDKPGEQLKLPKGYYYSVGDGITDKYNTESGLYEDFDYEYDVSHFAHNRVQNKKSVLDIIFD